MLPRHSIGKATEAIADELGEVLVPWQGRAKQTLVPRATSTPNTYSGNFGLEGFPFHTDLAHWVVPPRYLVLRCVRGFAEVPTLLLDGRTLAERTGVDLMARALVKPRRPHGGVFRMHRLLQDIDENKLVRWDSLYLHPASTFARDVLGRFSSEIEKAVPTRVVMVEDGDTLVVDNWRMLHARPSVPPNAMARMLERVYLRSLK